MQALVRHSPNRPHLDAEPEAVLPFTRAGFACLTLIRLEDGVPPNWHWPTDTAEHVDREAVEDTYRYAMRLAATVTTGSETVAALDPEDPVGGGVAAGDR